MRLIWLIFFCWWVSGAEAVSFFQANAGKKVEIRQARILKVNPANHNGAVRLAQDIEFYNVEFTESGLNAVGQTGSHYFGDVPQFHQADDLDNGAIDLFPFLLNLIDQAVFGVSAEIRESRTPRLGDEFCAQHLPVRYPFFEGHMADETVQFQGIHQELHDDETFMVQFTLHTSGGNNLTIHFLFTDDFENPALLSIYLMVEVMKGYFDHYVYTVKDLSKKDHDRDEGGAGSVFSGSLAAVRQKTTSSKETNSDSGEKGEKHSAGEPSVSVNSLLIDKQNTLDIYHFHALYLGIISY